MAKLGVLGIFNHRTLSRREMFVEHYITLSLRILTIIKQHVHENKLRQK